MKKGELLFVYGTLLRGERADINKNALIHSTSFMSKDQINGYLYHLGAFPGLCLLPRTSDILDVFDPDGPVVHGETYRVGDQSVCAILDAYEGYPILYNRQEACTKNHRKVWAYTFNPPVIKDQLIETGDWRNPRLVVTHRIPKVG